LKDKFSTFIIVFFYVLFGSMLLFLLYRRGDQPVGLIAVELFFTPIILMILSGLPLDIFAIRNDQINHRDDIE
tara:strand:- start:3440 stop:3658 length:219 start_codon:yes stop_codon:yes gene_type:complete